MFTQAMAWMILAPWIASAQAPCITMPGGNIRREVKRFIDGLADLAPSDPAHSTDQLTPPAARRRPADPKPFPAGRYHVDFGSSGAKTVWVDTETRLGHYVTVTPGATRVDGSVQLSANAGDERPSGPVLTPDEVDYLIAAVYARFCKPLDRASAGRLDRLKDMLLAVRFNGAPGMEAYHGRLARRVR